MNALPTLKLVIALLIAGLVSACASSGKVTITQPKTQAISPGKTVSLSVKPGVADPKPIHQKASTRVRDALFGKLVSNSIFKAVVHAPEPADYSMDVKISGARQVSTGARIWLGVMAGSNNITLTVQVHNQATNQLITAFEVRGESAAHPLSSQAGLDDAVREAVDRLIDTLR